MLSAPRACPAPTRLYSRRITRVRNELAMASVVLPAVLRKIDADLDQRLERLFDFLRIQSISTDPAYKAQCQAAAEHVAKDLSGFGFETSVRPTEGHPIV